MSNFIEERRKAIAIGRSSGIHAQFKSAPLKLDIGDSLNAAMERAKVAAAVTDLEVEPRATVLKMLTAKKLNEPYTFKVAKGEADNYIQAMRQVLSRTRAKASRAKKSLNEFKMMRLDVVENLDHDLVTLVRTKTLSEHQASVYDQLIAAFEKKDEE